MSVVDRLRQPEYTGEHRCLPCTIVNIAIAAVVSLILIVVTPVLGIGVFLGSLLIIYVRGYLVPGTPTLTKRYLPDRVLRWFDKEPTTTPNNTTIEPERALLDAQAVTPCENGTDLCLTDGFHDDWHEQMYTIHDRDDLGEADLRDALGATTDRISFEAFGDALLAHTETDVVAQWPSTAAHIADVAAAQSLAQRYPDWTALTPADRAQVLASLRIFLDECPECGEPIRIDQEAAESCCREYDVLLVACGECGAGLLETEWTEEMASA